MRFRYGIIFLLRKRRRVVMRFCQRKEGGGKRGKPCTKEYQSLKRGVSTGEQGFWNERRKAN